MRCLLDTHILLWSLLEPGRLSPSVSAALQDAAAELWISPISVWETLLLVEKGRIALQSADPESWIRDILSRVPLKEAPLNCEIARRSRTVDLDHADPADRFIAATALVYGLTLLTADERLLRCQQVRTLH